MGKLTSVCKRIFFFINWYSRRVFQLMVRKQNKCLAFTAHTQKISIAKQSNCKHTATTRKSSTATMGAFMNIKCHFNPPLFKIKRKINIKGISYSQYIGLFNKKLKY